jgi:hypothetical protein
MQGVEEGDTLDVDYLRDDKTASVKLTPQAGGSHAFNFSFAESDSHSMVMPSAPMAPGVRSFAWVGRYGGHGLGAMEMVELNASLGRYFGTDSGLLIVKAPEDNAYQLQDGDVLKSIDGRSPESLRHALRILNSYESGETVNLQILRDKKEKTITIKVPDNRHSFVVPVPGAAPAAIAAPMAEPSPAVLIVPRVRIVRKIEERT